VRSVQRSLEGGERRGLRYRSLAPSFIDVINARYEGPASDTSLGG
jgi:hypothetical protein